MKNNPVTNWMMDDGMCKLSLRHWKNFPTECNGWKLRQWSMVVGRGISEIKVDPMEIKVEIKVDQYKWQLPCIDYVLIHGDSDKTYLSNTR